MKISKHNKNLVPAEYTLQGRQRPYIKRRQTQPEREGSRLRQMFPPSERDGGSKPGGLRRRATMNNDTEWGEHVAKMTIFFDNVRCIPENRQRGRHCRACGGKAISAQPDDRVEPLAYICEGRYLGSTTSVFPKGPTLVSQQGGQR